MISDAAATVQARADTLAARQGEVLERFRFPLDETLVARFAEALRAAGRPAPTVLQASALHRSVVPHSALGLDPARVRHGEQRYLFARDLEPRPLEATVRLDRVFTREGRTGELLFAVVETEFADAAGTVATSAMTLVEMPPPNDGRPGRARAAETPPPADARRVEPPLSAEELRRYAQASGDRNPIHLDTAAAQAAGLPGVVVMGMLPAGMLGTLAAETLGRHPLGELRFRFVRPIWPGEEIVLEARREPDGLALRVAVDGDTRILGAAGPRNTA